MIDDLLRYQEADGKLRAVEQAISATEERKKYMTSRKFLSEKAPEKLEALDAKVAIITVPESAAADTAEKLMEAGIKGILNFSPITLKPHPVSEGETPVIIHNINIALELEQIFYQIQFPMDRKLKNAEG